MSVRRFASYPEGVQGVAAHASLRHMAIPLPWFRKPDHARRTVSLRPENRITALFRWPAWLGIAVGLTAGLSVNWRHPGSAAAHTQSGKLANTDELRPVSAGLSNDIEAASVVAAIRVPSGANELEAVLRAIDLEPDDDAAAAAIRALVPSVPLDEMPEALVKAAMLRTESRRVAYAEQLLYRWGEASPDAALTFLQGLGPSDRTEGTLRVLTGWTRVDCQAALAWVRRQPEGSLKTPALATIAAALVASAPESALALARERPYPGCLLVYRRLFESWAEASPAQAMTALVQHPSAFRDSATFDQVLTRWCGKDPRAAWTWVQTLPSGRKRADAFESVLGSWATANPTEAAGCLNQLPAGPLANRLTQTLAEQWAGKDPDGAMIWLQGLPQNASTRQAQWAVIDRVLANDPHRAVSLASGLTLDSRCGGSLGSLVSKWAGWDLAGALAWAQQIPDATLGAKAVAGLAEEWAASDPQAAATHALTMVPGGEQEQLLRSVIGVLAPANPKQAIDTLAQFPPSDTRNECFRRVSSSWAQQSPQAAADNIAAMAPGSEQAMAVAGAVAVWIQDDAAATADWVAGFPSGNAQTAAMGDVAYEWFNSDPDASLAWLNHQMSGSLPEPLLDSFVGGISAANAEYAAQWALSIANPDQRWKCVRLVSQTWRKEDPQAAETWINTLELSDEAKRELWAVEEPRELIQ